MTIQEAIKAGKPFRLPNHSTSKCALWCQIESRSGIIFQYMWRIQRGGKWGFTFYRVAIFTATDILTTDWEIKP